MYLSSANSPKSTAPPQAGKSSQIPKAVGYALCGSTDLLKLGTNCGNRSILFIANLTLANGAAWGFLGQALGINA